MKKRIIFIIILFLILIGVGVFIYFKYEYKFRQEYGNNYKNLSVSAEYKDKLVETGYIIEVNDFFYKQGKTLKQAPILEKIPDNSSIKVYNENINNQTFYATVKSINTTSFYPSFSIKLQLVEAEEINISHQGELAENESIILNLFSKNFKNVKICIKWSIHLVYVRLENSTEINKLKNYENYDKCYDVGFSLENEDKSLNITYKHFGILDNDDYIKVAVIDSDYFKGEYITTKEDKDIGAIDKIYEININNI